MIASLLSHALLTERGSRCGFAVHVGLRRLTHDLTQSGFSGDIRRRPASARCGSGLDTMDERDETEAAECERV
jgi:hypothetical protein